MHSSHKIASSVTADLLEIIDSSIRYIDELEAYFELNNTTQIELHTKDISLNREENQGLGIRAFCDKSVGFSHTTNFSRHQIETTAKDATILCRSCSPIPAWQGLPYSPVAKIDGLCDSGLLHADVKDAEEKAETLRNHLSKFSFLTLLQGDITILNKQVGIVNSHDLCLCENSTLIRVFLLLRNKHLGNLLTVFEASHSDDLDFRSFLSRLENEKRTQSIQMTTLKLSRKSVLLGTEATKEIIDWLANRLNIESGWKRENQTFAREKNLSVGDVTLIDDGRLPDGMYTSSFDGEGVTTQKTVLIERGTVCGYLHDLETAYRTGSKSTGNAVRSYNTLPNVGTTNTYMSPSARGRSETEILEELWSGIYIEFLRGEILDNGDFHGIASTFVLKKGEKYRISHELPLTFNVFQWLQKISETWVLSFCPVREIIRVDLD